MSEALYRKYRPQIFEDVVGQEHIERTIKNAIESDKVSHAYLFTGPRGTGKTTTARLLAKALLCEKGPTPEPDGTCEDCRMIANGEHPDVYELDAASRTGVENVREEIIGRVQFAPTRGRYKIYIIDEVHMLSTAAFNALLKTLEEPPSHVVFILATTDPQKVPETIHSRCQRFDFRRISNEAIVSRLGAICVAEGVEFEGEALDLVAHRAEGGMRNALTSLEQLIAFGEGRVTMEVAERMLGSLASSDLADIVRFVGTRDVAACFRWTAEFVETGADLAQFTRDLAEHMRNMYVMSLTGTDVALDVSEAARRELAEELKLFGPDRLTRLLGVLGDLSAELKTSTNPRLSFEIALTRMVRPDSDLTLESLAERIEALESGYSAVAHVVETPPSVHPQGGEPTVGRTPSRAAGKVPAQTSAQVTDAQAHHSVPQQDAQPSWDAQLQQDAQAQQRDAAQAAAQGQTSRMREVASSAHEQRPAQAALSGGAPSRAEQAAPERMGASSLEATAARKPSSESAGVLNAAHTGGLPAQVAASMQNPAALQRMWQAALATLKKAKAAYGVLFLNTKASFDAMSSTLVVDFPSENDFAFRAVQKPDVQDELAAALAQACGCPMPFRLTKGGEGSFAAAAVTSERGASAAVAAVAASAVAAAPVERNVSASASPAVVSVERGVSASAAVAAAPAEQGASGASASAVRSASGMASAAPVSGESRQVDATSQATPPASYETPTGYADFDDEVPVDLYEDMAPYDDADYYEPTPPAQTTHLQPQQSVPPAQSAQTRQPMPSEQPARSASDIDVSDAANGIPAHTAAAPDEPSLSDLDASLAFGFGEGVVFTEVRE